jgi:hypothetical protein
LKVNPSFLFDLQRLIDKYKPKLIISGSLIRTMKNVVENYKNPLFGRFDVIIKLKELDFKTIARICKDLGLNFETALKLYCIFGGVPKYYELIEKMKRFSLEKFILDMFVYYPRPLYEEVRTILKEEFGKEHKTFFSLLSAISQGKNKLGEIAGFVGKEQTKITKYMSMLIKDFEIVTRKESLIGKKRGIYEINQNLFEFWFSQIWKYQDLIEKIEEERLAKIVKANLNVYFGKIFEKVITGLIKNKLILDFDFIQIGKQWGKFKEEKGKNVYEIDIAAINEKTKEILFCECKWKDKVDAYKVLAELKEKVKYVDWNKDKRKESYAIFAKSFSKKTKEARCIDLKELEKIFL